MVNTIIIDQIAFKKNQKTVFGLIAGKFQIKIVSFIRILFFNKKFLEFEFVVMPWPLSIQVRSFRCLKLLKN